MTPYLWYVRKQQWRTRQPPRSRGSARGLTANQQSVASGIDRATAAGGNANPFLPLYVLTGSALGPALDQLSGEVHTGRQGLGVLVAGQFLSAMLDQNAFGHAPGGMAAYAPDALGGLPGVVAATQAADLAVEVIDTRRFAVWGAVFGSDGRIGGDSVIGSARRHERNFGLAAGVDARVAPNTVVGVALAGGGADASVDGRGSLSADVFQAGLYAMTRLGFIDLRADQVRVLGAGPLSRRERVRVRGWDGRRLAERRSCSA